MKKLLLIIAVLFFSFSATGFAQKIAYVDTEAVLEKMPAYQNAQQQLDKVVDGWNKEIQQRYKKIDEMYRKFQAEQVLLTNEQRQQREQAIVNEEKATRDFQKMKFGAEGDLFRKKQELVKPVQDKVYEAIEKLAQRRNYDFVLDKSSGVAILFANPKHDITGDVKQELGIK